MRNYERIVWQYSLISNQKKQTGSARWRHSVSYVLSHSTEDREFLI